MHRWVRLLLLYGEGLTKAEMFALSYVCRQVARHAVTHRVGAAERAASTAGGARQDRLNTTVGEIALVGEVAIVGEVSVIGEMTITGGVAERVLGATPCAFGKAVVR